MLHNDKDLFEQIVLRTADKYGIEAGIVEKDYFVTVALKTISNNVSELVFKGGTSLSKAYKIIKRFSEDVDLTIKYDSKPSESQRRRFKQNIVASIESLDLNLENADEIKSRREYNKYIISYPAAFNITGIKANLQIETMVKINSYPHVDKMISSIVFDYLNEEGLFDIIEEFNLEPFSIRVQSAERTFIDKLFAIMDYYLAGKVETHSRHVYDLYKLNQIISMNDEFGELYESVLYERKNYDRICLSAQADVNRKELLGRIVEEETYKTDYDSVTRLLLYEEVSYEQAAMILPHIIKSKWFK